MHSDLGQTRSLTNEICIGNKKSVYYLIKKDVFWLRVCGVFVALIKCQQKSGIIAVRVCTGTALASTHQIGLCRCKRFFKNKLHHPKW